MTSQDLAQATITDDNEAAKRHRRRNKPPESFSDNNNFALDRKIKEAIKGLPPSPQWMLMEFSSDEDKGADSRFYP